MYLFVVCLIGQLEVVFLIGCVCLNDISLISIGLSVDFLTMKALLFDFLSELIKLRFNYLVFSGYFYFSHSAFVTLINYVATVETCGCLMC